MKKQPFLPDWIVVLFTILSLIAIVISVILLTEAGGY
jgi:hypothetical protein